MCKAFASARFLMGRDWETKWEVEGWPPAL